MRRVLGIGKQADLSARNQLVELGYLNVKQRVHERGRFGFLEWDFNPEPGGVGVVGSATDPSPSTVGGLAAHGQTAAGPSGGGQPAHLIVEVKKKKKPPPPGENRAPVPAGGGGPVDQKKEEEAGEVQKLARRLCLTASETQRFVKKAGAASGEQLQVLEKVLMESSARDSVGLAMSLASEAAKGGLKWPISSKGEESPALVKSPAVGLLEKLDGCSGWWITRADGSIVGKVGDQRSITTQKTGVLQQGQIIKIMESVQAGEFFLNQ